VSIEFPTAGHLESFEITPPGTDGVATLEDGATLRMVEGGRITDECLEYFLGTVSPEDETPPAIVRYVGPRLYFGDDGV
jgi:hypothetical protein